jgi:hypothetical protein
LGWLIGYTLASMATSFIVVKIFDYIFAGATSGLVNSARASLFVATWTLVMAQAGMHGFSKRVRQLRQGFIKHTLR